MFLNYCHRCRAWSFSGWAHTQEGEDTGEVWFNLSTEFGPFDGLMDVLDYVNGAVEDALVHDKAPWNDVDYSWRLVDPDHPSLGEW